MRSVKGATAGPLPALNPASTNSMAKNPFQDPDIRASCGDESLRDINWDIQNRNSILSFAVSEAESVDSYSAVRYATATNFTSAIPTMVNVNKKDLGDDALTNPFADPVLPAVIHKRVASDTSDVSYPWRGPNLTNLIHVARGDDSNE
jgi:hypothetical protein